METASVSALKTVEGAMTVERHTSFLSIYTRLLNQTVLFLLFILCCMLQHLGPACSRNLICFHQCFTTVFTVTLAELFSPTFHMNSFPFLLVCSRQTQRADLHCEIQFSLLFNGSNIFSILRCSLYLNIWS